jgi:hypothetical protein
MLSTGRCPYWTKVYCENHSAPLLYYLSALHRAVNYRHKSCDLSHCEGDDARMDNYVTQHTTPGRKCAFKGFDVTEIASIIKRNSIPLVRLLKNDTSVISIDIVEYNLGQPFVAISYVWSRDLGNPVDNSLPEC